MIFLAPAVAFTSTSRPFGSWESSPCLFPCLELFEHQGLEVAAPAQAKGQGGDSCSGDTSLFLGALNSSGNRCTVQYKNHKNHCSAFRKGTEGREKLQALEINPGRIMERQYLIVHQSLGERPFPRYVTPRAELNIDLFWLFVEKKNIKRHKPKHLPPPKI